MAGVVGLINNRPSSLILWRISSYRRFSVDSNAPFSFSILNVSQLLSLAPCSIVLLQWGNQAKRKICRRIPNSQIQNPNIQIYWDFVFRTGSPNLSYSSPQTSATSCNSTSRSHPLRGSLGGSSLTHHPAEGELLWWQKNFNFWNFLKVV